MHCYTEKQKIESIQQSNLLIKFSVTNAKLIPNVDKSGLIVTIKVLRHFVTTTHRTESIKASVTIFQDSMIVLSTMKMFLWKLSNEKVDELSYVSGCVR